MNLIDKDALIESLGIETDCYDCEHERMKYHCDLDPVEACTKIVEAPVITVTTESAEKAIEVLKNAAWLGAVYSFEETEEAVKTAIRALQIVSDHFADVCENTCDFTRKSNDNISRADVCEILSDMYPTDGEKVVRTKCIDTAYDAVLRLPTVQPNVHDFPKDADCISRQAAIDVLLEEVRLVDGYYVENDEVIDKDDAIEAIRLLPSAQLEQRYTEEELSVFAHGISLSLLSKRSAQHWRYDEDTATEIKFLERLYEKVVADMGGEQDG